MISNFSKIIHHITSLAGIYLLKVNNKNTTKKVWNMFKVNYKDNRMTF